MSGAVCRQKPARIIVCRRRLSGNTRRGPALSVEAFDADGGLIFQAFPLAQDDRDSRPEWRTIVGALKPLSEEADVWVLALGEGSDRDGPWHLSLVRKARATGWEEKMSSYLGKSAPEERLRWSIRNHGLRTESPTWHSNRRPGGTDLDRYRPWQRSNARETRYRRWATCPAPCFVPGSAVASHHNSRLSAFADRLRERGKPHKAIIIAVARKLVTVTRHGFWEWSCAIGLITEVRGLA